MSSLTIQELQKKLDNAEKLLALLVIVADNTMPKLKTEIEQIVGTIKGGFDTTHLTEQAHTSINTAINESDYGSLINTMHSIKLQLTAEIKDWKHETRTYKEISKIKLIAISGLAGIVLGGFLTMCGSNSSKEYQKILSNLENQPTCKLSSPETRRNILHKN